MKEVGTRKPFASTDGGAVPSPDKAGIPIQELNHFKIIGQTVYYNSTDPDKFVPGGPGEVERDRIIYVNGIPALDLMSGLSFKVVLEGYGPIFLQTGRTIFSLPTGQVIFSAGPNAYTAQDLEAMCNALR